MKNTGKNILTVAIIIIVLVIIGVACKNISRQNTQAETQKFEDQMHQDPNTWTREQKDKYNDFVNWETKQHDNQ